MFPNKSAAKPTTTSRARRGAGSPTPGTVAASPAANSVTPVTQATVTDPGTPNWPKKSGARTAQTPANMELQEVLSGEPECQFSEEEMEKDERSPEKDEIKTEKRKSKISEVPISKKQKMNTGTFAPITEPTPMLCDLRWVHVDIKEDLVATFNKSPQEFSNCCNFWYRYSLWKKKDLTKFDRDQFAQAAFGVPSHQLQYNSHSNPSGNESLGIQVHRRWHGYGKYMKRVFRRQFEALLLQFLHCPETKGIVDTLCVAVRERGVQFIELESPCVSPTEIRTRFVKNNTKLVSDVWHPIMDAAPQNFLLTNGIWAQRFLDATCIVLAWIVTHFFRVEKAEENMHFELGKCPISTDAMNSAIAKADGTIPSDFFPPNKPLEWKQRKGPTGGPYGELKIGKIVKGIAAGVLEDDCERETNDPNSGVVLPCQPAEILECDRAIENTLYWANVMNTQTTVVRDMEAKAKKVREEWEGKAEKALGSLAAHKYLLDSLTRERQQRIVLERFLVECREHFHAAEVRETAVQTSSNPVVGGTGSFSTTEVLGGFAAYLGLLQKEGWFQEAVKRYDTGGSGIMSGGSMNVCGYNQGNQGNRGGISNTWGGHSGDMGNQQPCHMGSFEPMMRGQQGSVMNCNNMMQAGGKMGGMPHMPNQGCSMGGAYISDQGCCMGVQGNQMGRVGNPVCMHPGMQNGIRNQIQQVGAGLIHSH